MLGNTLQKYKSKLRNLQKQTKNLDLKITGEQKLYLESKLALEQSIAKEIKVENLQVNMLTYTPDISRLKDEDIAQLINQYL